MNQNDIILTTFPLVEPESQKPRRFKSKRLEATEFSEADLEKFWRRVDKRGPDECWPWIGQAIPKGYGTMCYTRNKIGYTYYAHRMAYAIANGCIPAGNHVRHEVCDDPPCCNPAHMSLGTNQDNCDDCEKKDRRPRGENRAQSKLSLTDVLSIISFANKGVRQRIIANRFHTTQSNISFIVNGKRWKKDVEKGPQKIHGH